MQQTLKGNIKVLNAIAEKGMFNEYAFYYLLKSVVNNSTIYNYKPHQLYANLRELRLIDKRLSQSKIHRYITKLVQTGLARIHCGNLCLTSLVKRVEDIPELNHVDRKGVKKVHTKSRYYSRLRFQKHTTFTEFKELLLLEHFKHTDYKQTKALEYNVKLASKIDNEMGDFKYIRRRSQLAESYYHGTLITYRTLEALTGLNISEVFTLAKSLISKGYINLWKVIKKYNIPVLSDVKTLASQLGIHSYCYSQNGMLVAVMGTGVRILKRN